LKQWLGKLFRFGLVGAAATALQYLILVLLVHQGLASPTASTIGFVSSAFGSYVLNYHFTFRSRGSHGPAMLKFMTLVSVGLALNYGLMQLLTGAGWYYLVAQVCTTGVVFLWNFIGNSLWTFRAYTGP
jgi:putative flippase GtrA